MEERRNGFVRIPKITVRNLMTVMLIVAGFALLLYPWISNYLYENQAKSEILAYEEKIEAMGIDESKAIFEAATEYNLRLYENQHGESHLTDPFYEVVSDGAADDIAATDAMDENMDDGADSGTPLSEISEFGVIGYIDIPCISVYLPVFEGTSTEVLQAGIGLLSGSSLPVGGKNTHAVLTGHTGLSTAKMFTDLTEVEIGNAFYFHILGETLAYEVIEIVVVEPSETALLGIRNGRDLMTLVTCTPYGVNSHRLYVTGERIEYSEVQYEKENEKSETVESVWMTEYKKAIGMGLILLAVIAVGIHIIHCLQSRHDRLKIKGDNEE